MIRADEEGAPDGMAIDADGNLWVAQVGMDTATVGCTPQNAAQHRKPALIHRQPEHSQ